MSNRPKRKRRCCLAVPASSDRKIEKALASGVDFIFLDLEDGVAPQAKPQARLNAIQAFNEGEWGQTVRCFRMNGIDSFRSIQDLTEVVAAAGNNIDTIMIPKVKFAKDVQYVATMLDAIEAEYGISEKIGLELLIEEVEGVQNIKELSEASDRVEALHFGIGDYTRAQGVDIRDVMSAPRYYPGDIWHYQRSQIVIAARCAGIDYIDGPFGSIKDVERFTEECRMVKTLGGLGKWAIHPAQIPIAMKEFTPDDEELQQAVDMKRMFLEAKAKGIGAIKMPNGGLLDEAILPIVDNLLDKATFYGVDLKKFENGKVEIK